MWFSGVWSCVTDDTAVLFSKAYDAGLMVDMLPLFSGFTAYECPKVAYRDLCLGAYSFP
jgi:hypothetical protein